MELLNGLLFSLPGTPVLYYGDEIGMGDNVFLGDRNGVRTPMQWSADRNAGFSRANPQRLILPIIIDPEYHYEAINVEAQQNNPNSLLWWTKRLIALRKRFQAFGRGTIEFLTPRNYRVLAFMRQYERRDHPGGRQPVALPAVRRARPVDVEGDAPRRAVRPHRVPADRRAALPADAAAATRSTGSRIEPPPGRRGRRSSADAYAPPTLACAQRRQPAASATSASRWRTRCRRSSRRAAGSAGARSASRGTRIEEAVALGERVTC